MRWLTLTWTWPAQPPPISSTEALSPSHALLGGALVRAIRHRAGESFRLRKAVVGGARTKQRMWRLSGLAYVMRFAPLEQLKGFREGHADTGICLGRPGSQDRTTHAKVQEVSAQ